MIKDIKQIPINYRYGCNVKGEVFNLKTGIKLSTRLDHKGYTTVSLCIGNRKDKRFSNHRLVALTWLPNPLNKPQVNHINGIKTDCRLQNLEWVTASENAYHAYNTGLRVISTHHINVARELGKNRVGDLNTTARKVIDIKNGEIFNSISDAAIKYKVCRTTLGLMLYGKQKNKTSLSFMYESLSSQKETKKLIAGINAKAQTDQQKSLA